MTQGMYRDSMQQTRRQGEAEVFGRLTAGEGGGRARRRGGVSDRVRERVWSLAATTGPYAPLVVLFFTGLLVLSASRVALVFWQSDRVGAVDGWATVLLQGIRVDVIQLGLLLALPVLLLPVLVHRPGWRLWLGFCQIWAILATSLLVFMEAATPGFIAEYDARPNRLFVEYLKYPREVFTMLWVGFRWHVAAGVALTTLVVGVMRWWMRPARSLPRRWPLWQVWLSWPLVVVLLVVGIRSSFDHRPANPAMFAFSSDTLVNDLVLNSTWSVAHAIYALRHESRSGEVYGRMEVAAMLAEFEAEQLRHGVAGSGQQRVPVDAASSPVMRLAAGEGQGEVRRLLGHPHWPTLSEQPSSVRRASPLNLVIVLEESLGATFVESLGGIPVTPNLERLKHDGWWFEQLYATGTRSVRGIEAVVSGFAPTPAQSVVKLSLAQSGFFTLADLLRAKGYATEFIYGGESHFDNMRSFFLGNGFGRVTDQNDYRNPVFKGSWGVSDEDLFAKTMERIDEYHRAGQPFFTLVFTSSNHAPFEYPDGRIEPYDADKATENNAVKYADHALGGFIDAARAHPAWANTLFLIVADHDIRVRGDSLVPVERFHIPGLILGADLDSRRVTTVASQIDLAPTLLSLMGVDAVHPMIGRDLTREPASAPGRAMMQFEQHYAWMEDDRVVVLRPEKAPTHAVYDRQRKRLVEVVAPEDASILERRALAHVLLPSWLYREQRYALPAD